MADLKLTGSPIEKLVADSIKVRQQIMSESNVGGNFDPTAKIQYVSQRMPWVRMSSSVNLSGAKATYFKQLTGGEAGSDNLAKRFILSNLATDEYFKTEGLQGYSNSLNLGIRPEPGITSVNVKHFNRFGSLRSTTVNFVCWTLEQLEIMDVLYMRPGYTVLLEFGHGVYVDATRNIKKTPGGIDFFNLPKNKTAIYGAIEDHRKESNYHYDAIFGFIKNFKWTFRNDGGYDCVTEIVSIGEVVESVKASFASSGVAVDQEGNTSQGGTFTGKSRKQNSDESSLEELSTVMHQILSTIKNDIQGLYRLDRTGFIQSTISSTVRTELTTTFPSLSKITDNGFTVAMYSPGVATIDNGVSNPLSADQQPTYIKLSLLLDILNLSVPADSTTKEKLFEFWTPTTVPDGPYHTYKYSQYRPSIDPGICLIHVNESLFDFTNVAEGEHKAGTYTSQNRIDEIFVNIDFALGQYTENIDILQYLKSILSGIQSALGNINVFELQYFEEQSLYAVVDRNRILESTYESRPRLDIFGNKTFAKGATLSSLLSPKITTMIAIGAQAGGSSGGIEGTAFAKLNSGLTDRIQPVKLATSDSPVATSSQTEGSTTLSPIDIIEGHLYNIYKEYQYIPRDCQDVTQIYADYLTDKVAENKNPSFSFVIPFEIALTLDGISGLKITEAFDISDEILPAPYKNAAGRSIISFLITGLDQNITSAGWVTNLRAQMYISETSNGKYGYNVDNIAFTPRETLFGATQPSSDGLSALYFNGVQTTPEAFVILGVHISPVVKLAFKTFFTRLINNQKGIRVDITSTTRSEQEQQRLYDAWVARGKTGLPASPPGASAHEIGMGVDFVISDIVTRQVLAGGSSTKQVWDQYKVGEIAKAAGLRWGGSWTGDQFDPVHVDMTTEVAFQISRAEFLTRYDNRGSAYSRLEKWNFDPTGQTQGAGPVVLTSGAAAALNAATGTTATSSQAGPVVNNNPTPPVPPTFN